jgi:phosphate transport system substrate-binding protein
MPSYNPTIVITFAEERPMQRKTFAQLLAYTLGLAILMAGPLAAETIKIGGTGGALGTIKLLAEAFKKEQPKIEIVIVPGLGSGGGRKALMGGALDLTIASRAGKVGEKLDGATARLFGRTASVFAVSPKTATSNMSIQEIIDVYNGKKIAWSDGERLRLILRPITDSDSEMLMSIGTDMEQALKAAHKREGMTIAITDEDSANLIESTPGALGTSTTAMINSEKRRLKVLSVKGVSPSPKTLADGSYPWFKSYYVVNKIEASAAARAFADFVVSPRAQPVIAKLGYWLPEAGESR